MRAGDLRQRIIIEQRSTTTDAANQPLDEWTPFGTFWAQVSSPKRPGEEKLEAGAFRTPQRREVRMRYTDGITADMRVNFGGRILDIVGVKNTDEQNFELVLDCLEGGSING